MLIQTADASINCPTRSLTNCNIVDSSYHYHNHHDCHYNIFLYFIVCAQELKFHYWLSPSMYNLMNERRKCEKKFIQMKHSSKD